MSSLLKAKTLSRLGKFKQFWHHDTNTFYVDFIFGQIKFLHVVFSESTEKALSKPYVFKGTIRNDDDNNNDDDEMMMMVMMMVMTLTMKIKSLFVPQEEQSPKLAINLIECCRIVKFNCANM